MQHTVVYLVHLDAPLGSEKKTALHYIGVAHDLPARIAAHRAGRGARMLAVAVERGIGFEVARIWQGGRAFERALKQRGHAAELCPVCSGADAYRRAAAASAAQLPLEPDDLPPPPAGVRADWYEIATQQRWRAARSVPAANLDAADAALC
jgi:hypothetical protein